jgi:hypothetical protein
MKRCIAWLLVALMAAPMGFASTMHDDDDNTQGPKREIRRLHPERERAKAIKKLREQMSRKAEPKADPWDTSDEAWGTVDLIPLAVKDSAAVVGRRLDAITESPDAADAVGQRRMTWQDEPVTMSADDLMPYVTVDGGDCLSKYVNREKTSNEVYFAFAFQDSVVGPLRLCVQYCGASPLNYDQAIFHIDGFDYIFYPSESRQGVTDQGQRWERSDDVLHPAYKDLVYALAHSHWVILKLVGDNGISHAKVLTDGQRDDFANVLALYRLLGGEL